MMRSFVTMTFAMLLCVGSAVAQTYPARPIRLIMPQSAGSSNDTIGRIVAAKMSELLKQQIVVDNRAGAGGVIGAEIAARANPDGYTLLSGSAPTHAVAPHIYRKLAYDPNRDFAPISLVVISQLMLAVNPSLPAHSVKALIELARNRPGQLNMASAGIASSSHLAGLMFISMTHIQCIHVPYKGGSQSAAAVVAGEAQWLLSPAAALMGHVRAGRLRALAIGGKARSSVLPNLPTIAEAGVPGFEFSSWSGIMAPAGTPRPVINRLHATIIKALAMPDLREQYAAQGQEPQDSSSPEEFAKFIRAEQDRMGNLARLAGIKPE